MSNNLGDACSICNKSEWVVHDECEVCVTCGIPRIVKDGIACPILPVDVTFEVSGENKLYKEFLRLLSRDTN